MRDEKPQVPPTFKQLCAAADYRAAGHELARLAETYLKRRLPEDEVGRKLNELAGYCHVQASRGKIRRWFKKDFPECIKLVPTDQNEEFSSGVGAAYEEGLLPIRKD